MLSALTIFAALTVAKCDPGPYFEYERVHFERRAVEGSAPSSLIDRYATIDLQGEAHGLRLGSMRYLRLSQTQPTPKTNELLLRDKRRLTTRRGCHRQLVHWVPLWPGDFRAEPEAGHDEAFVPGTIEVAADREHAVLTLETDGGPVIMRYTVGANARAASCAVHDGEPRGAAAIFGLLLVVGVRRRRPNTRSLTRSA